MTVQPFTVDVPRTDLDDLARRLDLTRWPDGMTGAGWDYGTDPDHLRELVAYWQSGFDWRAQERRLNGFANFRTEIDGVTIHIIHQRGSGPNPTPLLLLHGWPSSFVQMLDLVPLLTDPSAHGGDAADSFDVVVASLPGYGVQTQIALAHPESITGIHLAGSYPPFVPDDLSDAERSYIDAIRAWEQSEGAYAHLHRTKPQTLAHGLNDSPVGLAAWVLEKFRAWSDCGGDVEACYTKDELLTNISVYWFTQTINSSIRVYRDGFGADSRMGIPDVPTAHLIGHEQIPNAPEEWTRRLFRIDRYVEAERGGHFMEWEQPEIAAEDLRAFFHSLRSVS